MKDILLVIKIFGIVLSSASLIGNQRLIAVEKRLRESTKWEKLRQLYSSFFDSPRIPEIIAYIGEYSLYLVILIPVFLWFKLESTIQFLIMFFKLNDYITLPVIKEWVGNTFSFILPLAGKFFSHEQVVYFLLWFIAIVFFFIFFPIFFAILMGAGTVALLFVPYILTIAFSLIVWLATRPYVWLDSLVQQKKLESTLFALGVIIAIIGEVVDRYYFG